jgi:hypothetical protein
MTSSPLDFPAAQALAQLEDRFDTANTDTLAYETAIEHLVSVGFVRDTAVESVEQLRRNGYLYEGNDGIRLTDAE